MKKSQVLLFFRRVISFILRFAPAHLADFLLWPVSKRLFGKYSEVVHIGKGIQMRVYGDMEDMVNKSLLFMSTSLSFSWEPVTARLVLSLAETSKCVVIAGAHIGYYPLIVARVNPKATVYTFEPNPLIYDRLVDNLERNHASSVLPMQAALGDVSEKRIMYFDFGQSSLIETNRPHAGSGEVEIVTLDGVFEGKKLLPDLILLDAEGYEPNILAGATLVLERAKPDVIFELNPKALQAAGSSSEDLCSLFSRRGYKIFLIEEEHSGLLPKTELSVKLAPYGGSLPEGMSFVNAFATLYPERLEKMGVVRIKNV